MVVVLVVVVVVVAAAIVVVVMVVVVEDDSFHFVCWIDNGRYEELTPTLTPPPSPIL
jgi:hypothetical protein